MARKYRVINVCDRCDREEEADLVGTPEAQDPTPGETGPDWQYQQRFDAGVLEVGHPMAQQTDGSFQYLCDKCKLRIADLTALIYNRPLPKRRVKEAETPPLLVE